MSNEKSCTSSLRIASKSMKIDDITDALGISPTNAHEIGTPISSRSSQSKKREETLWLLSFDLADDKSLEEHIDNATKFIQIKNSELNSIYSKCDIEVFLSYTTHNGQGSFIINNSLSKKIAETGIDFIFDLYLVNEY